LRKARHVLLTLIFVASCLADIRPNPSVSGREGLLTLSSPPVARASRFSPISSECRTFQAPRLLHGDYSTLASGADEDLVINLIVATDGTVQSPIIVEGANNSASVILETVIGWRYRPAMCDGAPVDAEGQIKFPAVSRTTAEKR
jgi:hypothetical protein